MKQSCIAIVLLLMATPAGALAGLPLETLQFNPVYAPAMAPAADRQPEMLRLAEARPMTADEAAKYATSVLEKKAAEDQAKAQANLPQGQSRERAIDGDLFGRKGGLFHPFFTFNALYTDNLFKAGTAPESDSIYLFSPGLWIALPRNKDRILQINTSTVTPGGLMLSRDKAEVSDRRYQAYLNLGADFERYSTHDELNIDNYKIDGLIQYNFRGGLTIDLLDQYLVTNEGGFAYEFSDDFLTARGDRAREAAILEDQYTSNLLSLVSSYKISDKFRIRADYSNYNLNYDKARNLYRNRTDNFFSGYLNFRFKPKTELFAEYEYINLDYETNDLPDNIEHNIYGGFRWNMTAKSKGRLKLGYGIKDFSDITYDDNSDFVLELYLDHAFSSTDSLRLIALRKTNESTVDTISFALSSRLTASYNHEFSEKLTGNLNFSYNLDEYSGTILFNNVNRSLEDRIYSASPVLRYAFRKWLMGDLSYIYTQRNSSISELDYTVNTILFRVSLGL